MLATSLACEQREPADEPARIPASSREDYADAPLRTCDSRTEHGRPQRGPAAGDVRIGPGYFLAAGGLAGQPPDAFRPARAGTRVRIKIALVLRAGTRATLVLPRASREHAALAYAKPPRLRPPFTISNGGLATRFRACGKRVRARSYRGVLGPWALYPGEFCSQAPDASRSNCASTATSTARCCPLQPARAPTNPNPLIRDLRSHNRLPVTARGTTDTLGPPDSLTMPSSRAKARGARRCGVAYHRADFH